MRHFLVVTKPRFILLIVLKLAAAGALTGTAFILQNLIDFALEATKTMEGFAYQLGFSLAYVALAAVIVTFRGCYEDVYLNTCVFKLKDAYFGQLLQGKFSEVSRYDSSKYMSAMTNDVNIISVKYFQPFSYLLDNGFTLVFAFFSVMSLNWIIGLEMLALTSLMAIIPAMLRKAMDRTNKKYSEALQRYTERLKEILLGLSVVHAFLIKKQAQRSVGQCNEEVLKHNNHLAMLTNLSGGVTVLISLLLNIGLVGTGVYYAIQGKMEIGAIVAISNLAGKFYQPIQNIAGLLMTMLSTKSIGKDLMEVIHYQDDGEGKQVLSSFQKEICLKDLSFSYQEGGRNVLNHVSYTFQKGEKYLILGKSGSGKSTILKLIAKINDGYTGELLIDGQEYTQLSDASIRKYITLSQQDAYLFNKSLRGNIDILDEADHEKMELVIQQAQLSEFVHTLPNGLDTVINEETNQVSGGEKIRIALARALYKGGDVFLMDEVTSALDKATSEKVEEVLLSLESKTILNVCHKYNESTLPKYDEIIIIEDGEVALRGSYEEVKDDNVFRSYRYSVLQGNCEGI